MHVLSVPYGEATNRLSMVSPKHATFLLVMSTDRYVAVATGLCTCSLSAGHPVVAKVSFSMGYPPKYQPPP